MLIYGGYKYLKFSDNFRSLVLVQDHLTSVEEIEFKVGDNSYKVNNYTNLIDIESIIAKYKDSIRTTRIDENERLERLSFRLYGTMQFWDLILILNGITSYLQLPTSYDKVVERADLIYKEWDKELGKNKSDEYKERKRAEFIELENQKNEKYRNIKYIEPSLIRNFQLDIRNFKRDLKRL